jgi:hypothetical protein
MVARINKGQSISRAVNYNEQKLAQGKAQCLLAENYLKEATEMNFYEKLSGLSSYAQLNQRVKANSVHISLNFDNKDCLTDEKLQNIATQYMERIGFKDQPYLVYKHTDAGHQHIHIVSTNIRFNGSRIDMHNIGKNQSENARKYLEIAHNLVHASAHKIKESQLVKPLRIEKTLYGKAETKRAISNVLDHVLGQYKFSSLPELNAVLKTYNVTADAGEEGSRIKKHGGIYYRILDENGNKIGVPLKASLFYMQPTLSNLEKIFSNAQSQKPLYKQLLKSGIESAFLKKEQTMNGFIEHLKSKAIDTVLRRSDAGFIYGITFIDHKTKCVFNGSDLGKQYTAAELQKRLTGEDSTIKMKSSVIERNIPEKNTLQVDARIEHRLGQKQNIPEQIMTPETDNAQVPYELKKKKRKSKRQSH